MMVERDLIKACLECQEEAWGEFIERYTGFVDSVVGGILRHHGVDPASQDAEVLVVETFTALAEDRGRLLARYDPSFSLATYLKVIARARPLSHLRRTRSRMQPLEEAVLNRPSDAEFPDELAVQEERISLLRRAIEELPPRARLIVRLHYLEEMPYREIAELLGISVNSVGPAVSRAASRLRRLIGARDSASEERGEPH